MPDRRMRLYLAWPLLVATLWGVGCKEQAPQTPTPASVHGSGAPGDMLLHPLDDRLFQLGGEIDVQNRHPTAVMVITRIAEARKSRCSGVLISPRRVLTAGHCACSPRQATTPGEEGKRLIDPSACAETATIKTVTYKPPKPGIEDDFGSLVDVFRGSIRPHPGLRIVLDAQGGVLSSHADLAVITLDAPVKEDLRFLPLAESEVQAGESIVVVGYGYDEIADAYDGDRRASNNRVSRVPTSGDERITFEQPGRHPYKGDSGGPCLRDGMKGPELVGISSRRLGEGATFTSLYRHRDWLRTLLQ